MPPRFCTLVYRTSHTQIFVYLTYVVECLVARGGVRRAVPKGFPYFHVEWEDGGYAHIIEGEVRCTLCVGL